MVQEKREELGQVVTEMASTGLRTLCLAYTGGCCGGVGCASVGCVWVG
jgi:hypothetical protein